MSVPSDIKLLPPWRIIEDSHVEVKLTAELERELLSKHPLFGRGAKVCARRIDRDEVLAFVEDLDKPLAIVHLTWRKETDPRWPSTRFFASWDEWLREEMLPAHQEWTAKA
jgi:hypothetical protein